MRLKISVWLAAVFIVLMLPVKVAAQPQANTAESYPPSSVIKSLTIEPGRQSIGDGDNWPITWADDGDLYTVYCDGRGMPCSSRYSVNPCRYGPFTNLSASGQFGNFMFTASHSSFWFMRMAMFPSRTTSARWAA